jgi:hypothetical protein
MYPNRSSSLVTFMVATAREEKRDQSACRRARGPKYHRARKTPRTRKRRGYLVRRGWADGIKEVMMYSGSSMREEVDPVAGFRRRCWRSILMIYDELVIEFGMLYLRIYVTRFSMCSEGTEISVYDG